MKATITILGTLLITLTVLADTSSQANSKTCIEALNGKKVSFKFSGGGFWDKVSGLYTVSLSFNSKARGGMIEYTNNNGIDTDLKIYPVAKSLEQGISITRADQDSSERNVKILNCENEKEKKSCESSAGVFFRELALARSAARNYSDEIDQAVFCMIESLKETVL